MGNKQGTLTRLYLTPRDRGRPLTAEEFQTAQSREGFRYELIDGKLEVSPLPNLPHDLIREWLMDLLRAYARRHPEVIRRVLGPARVFLPRRRAVTAPEPDLAAYHDFPQHLPLRQRRWQDVSPVLVVEILSEDTADKDLVRNRALYLRVPSIREYWIVDPRVDAERPSLVVYRRRGSRWQRPLAVAGGDSYRTRLLPGFTLVLEVR
jgi:Uma2 family endonuclease